KGLRNKASDFVPKTKIEILCQDQDQEKIVKTVLDAAKTGDRGDGIVYVCNIDNLIRIRDGQTGEAALK
ncbi:MAG: P-II family nitrogen regulator, partial [Thaumarchaeota archaeon]|nr:P-II family nitrogen regulator [Nitrososphaerota archaeon]